jgi:hypothetical protein
MPRRRLSAMSEIEEYNQPKADLPGRFAQLSHLCRLVLTLYAEDSTASQERIDDLFARYHSIVKNKLCNPRGFTVPPHFRRNFELLKAKYSDLKSQMEAARESERERIKEWLKTALSSDVEIHGRDTVISIIDGFPGKLQGDNGED